MKIQQVRLHNLAIVRHAKRDTVCKRLLRIAAKVFWAAAAVVAAAAWYVLGCAYFFLT